MAVLFARRAVAKVVLDAKPREGHEIRHDNAAHFVETKRVADCADRSMICALKPSRPIARQLGRVSRLR